MNLSEGYMQVDAFVSNSEHNFTPSILIPVYNHEKAIVKTLAQVLAHSIPVLLVDDGSSVLCQQVLEKLRDYHPEQVRLLRLDNNGGKGAAVKAGLIELHANGYSHAIQIDADGQHDTDDLPMFLAMGKQYPLTLISGRPDYDESVPKLRYYSRYLTSIWVWINTLSLK